MEKVWSDESRYRNVVRIWDAVLRARRELGDLPSSIDIPDGFAENVTIDIKRLYELERSGSGHDIMALLDLVMPQLPEELRPYVHGRCTSMDPQETAMSLMFVQGLNILITDIKELMGVLREMAREFKMTPMIGRSHGMHAEPITFGVKCARWFADFRRGFMRLQELKKDLAVGKVSGTVGMYTLDPGVERLVCMRLGLAPIVTSQIVTRDLHARYMCELAVIGGLSENVATTIRSLQRPEIGELQEPFGKGQKGSSAMPHKRNPIGCENVCGLARMLRANAMASLETIATWDERDISNSAPERIYLPGSSELLDFMLARLTKILQGLIVNPNAMARNLRLYGGLIYSQAVQALLAEKSGMSRQDAHTLVGEVAQRCIDSGDDFFDALRADEAVIQHLTPSELSSCMTLDGALKNVDHIFAEVFGV